MSKRQFAWVALALLGAIVALGALWGALGPDKIVLTAAQLQERVNRALPRNFKGVTVEQATVAVAENRVALRVETRAAAFGQTFAAVVSARGIPRYDSERGEVFFDADDVQVVDFALAGGKLAERVDRLGAGLRERIEAAAGQAIAAGLKAYLAARPVYRFKDDLKGLVVKTSVSSIATRADAIAISVSVLKVTVTTVVGLAALLGTIALMVQLVRHPGWGSPTSAPASAPAQPQGSEATARDPAGLTFLLDCADLFTERIKEKLYWGLGAGLKKLTGRPFSQTGNGEVWLGFLLFIVLLAALGIYIARNGL
jgi:hypothetical protein